MFAFIFTATFLLCLLQVLLPISPGDLRAGHTADTFCRQRLAARCHRAPAAGKLSAWLCSFQQPGFLLTNATGALLCRVVKRAKISLEEQRHGGVKPSQLLRAVAIKICSTALRCFYCRHISDIPLELSWLGFRSYRLLLTASRSWFCIFLSGPFFWKLFTLLCTSENVVHLTAFIAPGLLPCFRVQFKPVHFLCETNNLSCKSSPSAQKS